MGIERESAISTALGLFTVELRIFRSPQIFLKTGVFETSGPIPLVAHKTLYRTPPSYSWVG